MENRGESNHFLEILEILEIPPVKRRQQIQEFERRGHEANASPGAQNETAPEKLLNRYEKRFEKREKDPKNDPKRVWKMFSPSQAA